MVIDVYCTKKRAINGRVDNIVGVRCYESVCVAFVSLLVVRGPDVPRQTAIWFYTCLRAQRL